ncbi:hypothetical protein Sango_1371300 [Sesamum angolense]|uniref:AT hook motif-containing protein n=1 Tax=Sesamum angolense TaxID=2727404 RepID=A0AAE2BVA0_9LAMI|nr:hypothetical protein Sango_1371300 [Sesamum angolense]
MTDVSVSLPAKRKRGRPRKDANLSGNLQLPESPTLVKTQRVEVISPKQTQEIDKNHKDCTVDDMVGSMIYGVIEGSFDAGYLISVRIGNNDTPLRGVVFQPGKFIPVTAATDVAPQAKMYQRREIPVPVYDDPSQISGLNPRPQKLTLQPVQASKQPVLRPILPSMPLSVTPYSISNHSTFMAPEAMRPRTSSSSNVGGQITVPTTPKDGVDKQSPTIHPTGSLRMVEQDEVMQAFEVSTSSKGSKSHTATTRNLMSESPFKATTSSLPTKESINQKPQVHGKTVESELGSSMFAHNKLKASSGVEFHHNFMEDMSRSSFEIQQDRMIRHEMDHHREFIHDGAPQSIKREQQRTDLYYNALRSQDVNFHQDVFTSQSQPDSQEPKHLAAKFHPGDYVESVSKSPSPKLDLASATQEKKRLQAEAGAANDACLATNYLVLNELKTPNLGYHQALVAGNPLLLPPDLITEPMEFMLEKARSPSNSKSPQETHSELESRIVSPGERFHSAAGICDPTSSTEAARSPAGPYKLELASPQSNPNTGPAKQTTITGMDFVLSDVVQPTESHSHHRGDLSETKHG